MRILIILAVLAVYNSHAAFTLDFPRLRNLCLQVLTILQNSEYVKSLENIMKDCNATFHVLNVDCTKVLEGFNITTLIELAKSTCIIFAPVPEYTLAPTTLKRTPPTEPVTTVTPGVPTKGIIT